MCVQFALLQAVTRVTFQVSAQNLWQYLWSLIYLWRKLLLKKISFEENSSKHLHRTRKSAWSSRPQVFQLSASPNKHVIIRISSASSYCFSHELWNAILNTIILKLLQFDMNYILPLLLVSYLSISIIWQYVCEVKWLMVGWLDAWLGYR